MHVDLGTTKFVGGVAFFDWCSPQGLNSTAETTAEVKKKKVKVKLVAGSRRESRQVQSGWEMGALFLSMVPQRAAGSKTRASRKLQLPELQQRGLLFFGWASGIPPRGGGAQKRLANDRLVSL